jgi:hypothetical protein
MKLSNYFSICVPIIKLFFVENDYTCFVQNLVVVQLGAYVSSHLGLGLWLWVWEGVLPRVGTHVYTGGGHQTSGSCSPGTVSCCVITGITAMWCALAGCGNCSPPRS